MSDVACRLDGIRLEPTMLIYKPVKQLGCDAWNDVAYIGYLKSLHIYTAGNFAHVLVHSGSYYPTPLPLGNSLPGEA